MSWILAVLVAIDQLGNAIAGGNPDATVSARVGYWAINANAMHRWYWLLLQSIINFTFAPIDGPNHCYDNYQKEKDEDFKNDLFNVLTSAFLGLIIIVVCVPLSILLRIAVVFLPGWRYQPA